MAIPDQPGSQAGLRGSTPVFEPPRAAYLLRRLGLTAITAGTLRARAHKKKIPFHRNGRRLFFTLADIKEIADSEPYPRRLRDGSQSGREN